MKTSESSVDIRLGGGTEIPIESILLLFVIVTSIIDTTDAMDILHVLTAVPAVMLFGVVSVMRKRVLALSRVAFVAYISIWLIYIPHSVFPTIEPFAVVRIPVFMVSTFILLFIAPQTVSRYTFIKSIFLMGVPTALLGIATVLIGDLQFLSLNIVGHQVPESIPLTGITIEPAKSYFSNPNSLGLFSCLASIAGLAVFVKERHPVHIFLLSITTLGLLLSLSRASILAFGCVVVLFGVYKIQGLKGVYIIVALGSVFGVYASIALLGLAPDVLDVRRFLRFSRAEIWRNGLSVVASNPLFGVGFQPLGTLIGTVNPHNSYLYILLTRGIIGGAVHMLFLAYLILRVSQQIDGFSDLALFGMMVAFLVVMNFESIAIFGFSLFSVLISLVLGYAVADANLIGRSQYNH